MLEFYESFQRYHVPESLKGEIFSADKDQLDVIETFNKINIFVGPNNSGKSLILRELIKQDSTYHYSEENWAKILILFTSFWDNLEKVLHKLFSTSDIVISNSGNGAFLNFKEFIRQRGNLLNYTSNFQIEQVIGALQAFINTFAGINRDAYFYQSVSGQPSQVLDDFQKTEVLKLMDQIPQEVRKTIELAREFYFSDQSKGNIPKYYIPPIRTLRQFGSTGDLLNSLKNDYRLSEKVIIINGQDFPRQILEWKNDEESLRLRVENFEHMLSVEFFEGKTIRLTPRLKNNFLYINIGNEKEKPIHELGDGLQMLICLSYPFFFDNKGIVFIDEPEISIHPGLQKAFLKFLMNEQYTKNFQIFISTHSNHILDSISQSSLVSIFSVSKKEKQPTRRESQSPDFVIENLANGHENLLNCLGISSSSVYLANCTIWVEGITDKTYLQKFINIYTDSLTDPSDTYYPCKFYKEGVHYAFTLSGGDSIIHWDFSDESEVTEQLNHLVAKTFCSKALVIVDGDFNKNPSRKQTLPAILKDRFIVHELPEIENFLSSEVIAKTVMEYPSIKEVVGQKIIPAVSKDDLRNFRIGHIIDNIMFKEFSGQKTFSRDREGNSGLRSGDKVDFCLRAVKHITIDDLLPATKALVEKVLDFIISRNRYTV